MFSRRPSRTGLVALASLALLIGVTATSSGSTAAAASTPTTACPIPEILGGMTAVGATIATPGSAPRTLDQRQATAFMQTWVAYSVFEKPPQEHPPANLRVSTLTVNTVQDGSPSPFTVFYATDGTSAWVGAPAPAPVPPPPNDQKWIRAPQPAKTIAAFNGTMAPICARPASSASTTPGKLPVKADGTSSDNGTFWILIVAGVLVVAAAAVAVARVRRRRTA